MSVGFQHPAVKTHIGDGFKFLADRKNEFDVIITDSSDPKGPAESLFQKPYFQLLHDALREGGVITTQGSKPRLRANFIPCDPKLTYCPLGENQWLHLPLITTLKKSCQQLFPTVKYAYTVIPTYPGGQIGFMVCCKDPERDVTKPLRSWKPEEEEKLCRYYSKEMHQAAFVLPVFARKALE